MEDTLSAFFDALADAVAERVLQKMHGVKETYTVAELAERYGCSTCTISSRLAHQRASRRAASSWAR